MQSLSLFRSLRYKLSVGVLVTTFLALLLSASIIVTYDLHDYRERTLEDMRIQADLLGQSSVAALQLTNRQVATKNLALLKLRPQIIAAAIYTAKGEVLATYFGHNYSEHQLPPLPTTEQVNLRQGLLSLPRRIIFDGEIIGHIFLLAEYPFYARLARDLSITLGVGAIALLISMLLTWWIQSGITRPIMAITNLAHDIVQSKNYQLRATKLSDDEIGYLVEAFNNMLAEIEQRTNALEQSNAQLNLQVEERSIAERSLRNSELRHRTLLTALSSVVWRANAQGQFLLAQPQWQQFTGQHVKQYVHDGWLQAIHPEDREIIREQWQKTRDRVSQMQATLRLWHCQSDGYRYVRLHAVPLLDDQSIVQEWIGVIDDIHDQVLSDEEIKHLNADLEQRVNQRTAELEQANKELESFSYSVSHDLRSPLRSIDGFSQALLEDYQDTLDEQGKDYLQRVRSAAQRMGSLIDDLLRLSRITRVEMEFSRQNLSEIAEKIIFELKEYDTSKRKVNIRIQPEIHAYGDYQLLYLMLENLLGNAWKYSSKKDPAEINFGTRWAEDGTLQYFIQDNGAGFDMSYAGRLFGAFQRLHDTADYPGSGIGLATVQRIINRHGGRIWAEAEVNKGAVFYFTLPFHEELTNEQQTYSVG